MSKEYVAQEDGAYRVAGTRVSLDSVVYAFRRGASPESIQSRTSPGLLIIPQHAELLTVIEELILVWVASEAEEYVNSVRSLPL